MNTLMSHALPALLGLAVKGTVLLCAAWAGCWLLRRSSAATRHLVWSAALAGVLLLPVMSLSLPHWNVAWGRAAASRPAALPVPTAADQALPPKNALPMPTLPTPQAVPIPDAATDTPPPVAPKPPDHRAFPIVTILPTVALSVWLLGVLSMLSQLAVGLGRIGRVRRQAAPLEAGQSQAAEAACRQLGLRRRVAFLRATDEIAVAVPVTWGVLRPVVLLPVQSSGWSEECWRTALLHELAHVQRWDWGSQLMARLVCALYWWHPLVWWAARQARWESERACDDLVLGTGMPAADYAQRLLEVVRSLPTGTPTRTIAIAMAQSSEVEGRLQSVLAKGRRRSRLSRRSLALTVMAVIVLLLPLAALRPIARAQAAHTSGEQTGLSRQKHDTLKIVYLKHVASQKYPNRPWTMTGTPDGVHGVIRATDSKTGESFRDGKTVQADFNGLLAQGWQPRPGAAPYLVPRSLSVGVPTRHVFFTPDQRQFATKLEKEKAVWDHLIHDSPVILTGADIEPQTRAVAQKVNINIGAYHQTTMVGLEIHYTPEGAKKMAAFSAAHQGEIMGYILDDGLLTAPYIEEPTWGEKSEISGGSRTLADAQRLAQRINDSAAPRPPGGFPQFPAAPPPVTEEDIRRWAASAPPAALLGMWQTPADAHGLSFVFEFRADGTETESWRQGTTVTPFTYRSGKPLTFRYAVSGNRMAIIYPNHRVDEELFNIRGNTLKFTKILVFQSLPNHGEIHGLTLTRLAVNTSPAALGGQHSTSPPPLKPVYGFRRYVSPALPDGTRFTFLYPAYYTNVQQGWFDQTTGVSHMSVQTRRKNGQLRWPIGAHQCGWVHLDCTGALPVPWAMVPGQTPISYSLHGENGTSWLAPHEEFCSVVVGRAGEVRFPQGTNSLHSDTRWVGENGSHHALSITDKRTDFRFLLIHEDRYMPALFRQTDPVISGSFRILPPGVPTP